MTYSLVIRDLDDKFTEHGDGRLWSNLTHHAYLDEDITPTVHYFSDDEWQEMTDCEHDDFLHNDLQEKLTPCYNIIHLLQADNIADADLVKIAENARFISVIEDEYSNKYLSLNSSGMDFSDSLAYAYMVIDKCVPAGLQRCEHLTLDSDAYSELSDFLRARNMVSELMDMMGGDVIDHNKLLSLVIEASQLSKRVDYPPLNRAVKAADFMHELLTEA